MKKQSKAEWIANNKERVEAVATSILDAFKAGKVPAAIAQVFLGGGRHCDGYSWLNRIRVILAGYSDAMGYRDWQRVGRQVRKGEKGFGILGPCMKTETDEATGEKRSWVCGFKVVTVHGIEQTDIVDAEKWAKYDKERADAEKHLDTLPLREVAEAWGLTLGTFNGKRSTALGWYRHGEAIAVGVENLATWAHELVHAADYRNGKLTEKGQHWRSETVAELGGAVLLMLMGYETEADLGGAYEYITKYAKTAELDAAKACNEVLNRTCEAVAAILKTADEVGAMEAVAA